MAEAAAGLAVEASLPNQLRWIPKKMEVDYLKKANSDLRAVCRFDPGILASPGEVPVEVYVTDKAETVVFKAKIIMYISAKKSSQVTN